MALSAAVITIQAPAATGSQTYSSIGFQGKVAIFLHSAASTSGGVTNAGAHGGYGAADGTSQWAMLWGADDLAASSNTGQDFRTTACVVMLSGGTPTVAAVASFTAFTSTGFTLNWTQTSSGAQVKVLVMGGADMTNVKVGTGIFPTTNVSNAAGPTLAFQPSWLITCGGYQSTSATSGVQSHSPIGFAANYASTITQAAYQYFDQDAQNTMSTALSTSTTACLVTCAAASVTTPITAVLNSFTATGWTWTWSNTAATANMQYGYIAGAGGAVKVVTDTAATTNTTKVTSGVGFTPTAGVFAGTRQTTAANLIASLPDNTALLTVGVVASNANGSMVQFSMDANGTSQTKRRIGSGGLQYSRFTSATGTTPATIGAGGDATFTLQADGWLAVWTNVAGTAHLYTGLVFGDTPAAGVTGSLAASLPALTGAISAGVVVTGSTAPSLPALIGSISAGVIVTGSTAASLPALTGSFSGTVAASGITGSLAATLPAVTSTISGTVPRTATLSASIPILSAAISGTVAVGGSVAAALPGLSGALVAGVVVTGSEVGALPALAGSFSGTVPRTGSVAAPLPPLAGAFAAAHAGAGADPFIVGRQLCRRLGLPGRYHRQRTRRCYRIAGRHAPEYDRCGCGNACGDLRKPGRHAAGHDQHHRGGRGDCWPAERHHTDSQRRNQWHARDRRVPRCTASCVVWRDCNRQRRHGLTCRHRAEHDRIGLGNRGRGRDGGRHAAGHDRSR